MPRPRHLQVLLVLALLPIVARAEAETRTWTDIQGRTIEAEFVSYGAGTVKLKISGNGAVYDVPLSRLSGGDQDYIRSLAATGRSAARTTVAVVPASGEDSVVLARNQPVSVDDASEGLSQDRFPGRWSNIDKNTRSHIDVEISRDGADFQIRVLHKSHPPHWSEWTTLHLLGSNVSAKSLPYGFATWDHGFATLHLIVHVEEARLVVESYDIFKDNSGRSNFRIREIFKRSSDEQPESPEPVESPPDRYTVPDGDVAELVKFIESMRSYRPRSAEEYREFRAKSPAALKTAAERILSRETDESSDAYQLASRMLLEGRVQNLRSSSRAEKKRILDELAGWLADKAESGLTDGDLRLALSAARTLDYAGDYEAAAEAYSRFIDVLEASDDENAAPVIEAMKAPLRRLRLPGNEIELAGTRVDGSPFDWDAYRGKVVLIDFWATWCGPCRAEIPHVKKHYEVYHDRGFDVVGISIDRDRTALADFLEKEQIPWTTLFDEHAGSSHPIADYYGVTAVPTMMLVDKEGKVVSLNARGQELQRLLQEQLGPVDEEELRQVEERMRQGTPNGESRAAPGRSAGAGTKAESPGGSATEETNAEGDELSFIAFEPPLPHVFKTGERLTVIFAYKLQSAEQCQLFVRPITGGRKTPGYGAHGSPWHPRGTGNREGWFTLMNPGRIDQVRIEMVAREGSNRSSIMDLDVNAEAEWGEDEPKDGSGSE